MLRVVLDTNIVISALLSAKGLEACVLSLALNRRVVLVVSPAILREYKAVRRRPRFRFDPDMVSAFLVRLLKCCLVVHPRLALEVSPDESDNRFLECARAGKLTSW